ncbi:MAG: DNA-protecting protein DprA [Bacteroidales bacterium]|nr:DNA-protecting protein DprA [Bacteroidales bacterium]
MEKNRLRYLIALSIIPGIGITTAKKLIAYAGTIENVFLQTNTLQETVPRLSKTVIASLKDEKYQALAEKEIEFMEKHNINALCYLDKDYPERMKHCEDAPILLYKKGVHSLESEKIISIVGTRNASSYGKEQCKKLIEGLQKHNPVIISGLAYGVDYCAHKYALDCNLNTIAVVGHSLDKVYPADHKLLAKAIEAKGCLVSEFHSTSPLDKFNFVTRNRIIAGMADATIVIESAKKGGALLTAEYANNYNRDVFALPGKVTDNYSLGCNNLIKQNKAHLFESVSDIEYILNWEHGVKTKPSIQRSLFVELTPEEEFLISFLKQESKLSMDALSVRSKLPISKVSAMLLNMEFAGMVKLHPGKVYEYCGF